MSSCHGPSIFPGIIDSKTGKSIIDGKTITGFTTEAEDTMEVMPAIRSWKEPLVDEWAEKLGAKCKFSPNPRIIPSFPTCSLMKI